MNGNGRYTSYTLADGKTTCPRRSVSSPKIRCAG